MPTLAEIRSQYPQYRDLSDSDLSDALHKKFYSDMPKAEFDKRMGVKNDDVYTATARKEFEAQKAAGVPVGAGFARRALQGATFNAADEILAGLSTPLEMIKRGTFNPAEGYRFAKAREDLELAKAREQQGALGAAAEIAGGVLSGSGLAKGGLTLMKPGAGILRNAGAGAVESAGYGGVAGAMEGNSLEERARQGALGAGLGLAVGGAVPVAASVAQHVAAPVISNIRARINPEGVARSQVARALAESSRSAGDVADDVTRAAAEGQGVYTIADALGNPGQRMLSSVARAPGPGRTNVVEFLDQRQAGQARRVANALAEGFDVPATAGQARATMTHARDRAADLDYSALRRDAGPVDVSNVIANIDRTLSPGVNQIARPASTIANDSVEAALSGLRSRLTDGRSVLTDFTAIQRVRGDLADQVEAARRAGQGNRARMLGNVLRDLDTSMEAASEGFRQANRDFAARSRAIDAIDAGSTAAQRGRSEDIVPAYRAMPVREQAGYRIGYVDPLIAQAEGAAIGVNKARPLLNDAFAAESAAIAPMRTQAEMMRRLRREDTMFQTRNHATGNSKTADNLADAEALRIDPSLVANVMTGNWSGAALNALGSASRMMSGSTPEVRRRIAEILLSRGENAQNIAPMLNETVQRQTMAERIGQALMRGGYGGTAVAPSALSLR